MILLHIQDQVMMEKGKNIIMNADGMKKTGNTILDYRYIIFMLIFKRSN